MAGLENIASDGNSQSGEMIEQVFRSLAGDYHELHTCSTTTAIDGSANISHSLSVRLKHAKDAEASGTIIFEADASVSYLMFKPHGDLKEVWRFYVASGFVPIVWKVGAATIASNNDERVKLEDAIDSVKMSQQRVDPVRVGDDGLRLTGVLIEYFNRNQMLRRVVETLYIAAQGYLVAASSATMLNPTNELLEALRNRAVLQQQLSLVEEQLNTTRRRFYAAIHTVMPSTSRS